MGRRDTYSEHILALAVEDACARLELLAAEELGEGQGDRVGGPRHDRLGLTLLVLVLVLVRMGVLVLVVVAFVALLLCLLLLCLHPLGGLPLEVFCARVSCGRLRSAAVRLQTHQ